MRISSFSTLDLLCDCTYEEAGAYLRWLEPQTDARIVPHQITLPSPTDFDAIYRHARAIAAQAAADAAGEADQLTFHLSPGTPAMAAVWIILAKTRFPAELIESSIQHGVRTVSVPFQISADFIPDLLQRRDTELTQLTAGLPPAAAAFDACGAIAPELIESELFGHEKGAFTGAASARKGVFEAAHTGTLFLDEIGELPKSAQARFLRALQEGEITRVGATMAIRVDVRPIAATNRSLTREVSEGRFREDLFYRLAAMRSPGRAAVTVAGGGLTLPRREPDRTRALQAQQ